MRTRRQYISAYVMLARASNSRGVASCVQIMDAPVANSNSCYYYGYGSNMSAWRISKNCPPESAPAEFVGAARLDHHRLWFSGPDWPSWRGAPANISRTSDERHVWGVLWKISQEHLRRLDEYVCCCMRNAHSYGPHTCNYCVLTHAQKGTSVATYRNGQPQY